MKDRGKIESGRVYSIVEAAEVLGIGQGTTSAYVREGQIKASKIGRSWRITGEALAEFVERGAQVTEYSKQIAARRRARREAREVERDAEV